MGLSVTAMDKLNQANSEDILKEQEMIVNRMKRKSSEKPSWYQELSSKQMCLADELYEAVRDDHDFHTTFKVKELLRGIGIHPVAKSNILSKALIMSRGNDLAFLWFLLDICYFTFRKFTTEREYTLNERLLLCCIAHLDMITTIRGLAQILPRLEIPVTYTSDHDFRKSQLKRIKHGSPFLVPNPKPEIPVFRRLTRSVPKPTDIHPYHVWCDPNHVVINEQNRWFSHRSDNPVPDVHPLSSVENLVNAFLDETIDNVTSPNFDKSQVLQALCLKHQKNVDQDRRDQILEKIFQEKSREFITDIEEDVVHQIELDLATTRDEFERLAKKYQEQTIVRSLIQEMVSNTTALEFIQPCEDCSLCKTNVDLYRNLLVRKLKNQDEEVQEISQERHKETDETKVTETYFHAPTGNNTFEFDYRKIFEDDFRQLCPIKAAVNKVFDLGKFMSEEDAINAWFHNVWKYELEMWNEKQKVKYRKEFSSHFDICYF